MDQWIDLTLKLNEKTLPFPGDKALKITWTKTLKNDGYNLSNVSTTMHLGTHIDYQHHVLDEDGEPELNQLIGKANVLEVEPKNGVILTKDIEQGYAQMEHQEKMLILSFNHAQYINQEAYFNYPKFESSMFDFLIKHHIQLLGADLPSYEYHQGDFLKMHKDCLSHDIYLLENVVHLQQLKNHIDLMVIPLPIQGLEASLVRVIAKNI